MSTLWGSTITHHAPPILDLPLHLPALTKRYRAPLNANVALEIERDPMNVALDVSALVVYLHPGSLRSRTTAFSSVRASVNVSLGGYPVGVYTLGLCNLAPRTTVCICRNTCLSSRNIREDLYKETLFQEIRPTSSATQANANILTQPATTGNPDKSNFINHPSKFSNPNHLTHLTTWSTPATPTNPAAPTAPLTHISLLP